MACDFCLTESNISFSFSAGLSPFFKLGIDMLSIDYETPLLRMGIKGNRRGTLTLLLNSLSNFSAADNGTPFSLADLSAGVLISCLDYELCNSGASGR